MVERHEDDVDDDTERDGQLGERVEDQIGQDLAGLQPDVAAIPDAEDVDWLFEVLAEDLFVLGTLVVVVVHEPADVCRLTHRTFGHLVDDVVQYLNILKINKWMKIYFFGVLASSFPV